jgi:hypothetical protein
MYAEYANNKYITKLRIYFETMEEVLPGIRVYVQSPENGDPLKIMDITNGGGTIE